MEAWEAWAAWTTTWTSRTPNHPRDAPLRWAEVDTAALAHNARSVRSLIGPGPALMAMVKANGYGHGAEIAARAALQGGATWLGVYTPHEALSLRGAGFDQPLLVVGWSPPETHALLIAQGVDITVFDVETAESIAREAQRVGRDARVHVKIDTGLGRLGVRVDGVGPLAAALEKAAKHVKVGGLFTHFANAETDAEFTHLQHERFLATVAELRRVAPDALLHAAGSAAVLRYPAMHHDLVRLGIAMYGYAPRGVESDLSLRPVMTVLARIAQVKTVEAGDSVGYGRTWRAPARRRIATVAMGYGQGLWRALSNRGHMVVNGIRCPVVGTVSMDQVTVDVTHAGSVAAGDPAMYFGERDGVRLGADEVAEAVGTIAYEVLCAVSAAVPREVARHPSQSGTVGS
jgi:alanine racemase